MTSVVLEVVLGEAGEAHRHGVAGAPLVVLLHELEAEAGAVLHQLLGDALGAVAHDDDGPIELGGREGVEDVQDHGPPAQEVQRLGPGGPHAGSLTSRQHDGRKTTRAHTDRSTPYQPTPVSTRLRVARASSGSDPRAGWARRWHPAPHRGWPEITRFDRLTEMRLHRQQLHNSVPSSSARRGCWPTARHAREPRRTTEGGPGDASTVGARGAR